MPRTPVGSTAINVNRGSLIPYKSEEHHFCGALLAERTVLAGWLTLGIVLQLLFVIYSLGKGPFCCPGLVGGNWKGRNHVPIILSTRHTSHRIKVHCKPLKTHLTQDKSTLQTPQDSLNTVQNYSAHSTRHTIQKYIAHSTRHSSNSTKIQGTFYKSHFTQSFSKKKYIALDKAHFTQ